MSRVGTRRRYQDRSMPRSAFLALTLLAALERPAPAATEPSWVERLSAQALSSGAAATLPPNLSSVLGLTMSGTSTSARQLMVREGAIVHTFNVLVSDHRKVVLVRVDESAHAATALLVSLRGTLRKAVAHEAGQPAAEVAPAAAGFDGERRFWSGRAPAH